MDCLMKDASVAAEGSAAGSVACERRARVRYRLQMATNGRAFISNTFRVLPAKVVDLSLTGVALTLPETLPVGTRVNIELDGVAANLFEMLGEVVYCTEIADGTCRCGCTLVWALSEDELRLLTK
jgi:hypothetical protein